MFRPSSASVICPDSRLVSMVVMEELRGGGALCSEEEGSSAQRRRGALLTPTCNLTRTVGRGAQ